MATDEEKAAAAKLKAQALKEKEKAAAAKLKEKEKLAKEKEKAAAAKLKEKEKEAKAKDKAAAAAAKMATKAERPEGEGHSSGVVDRSRYEYMVTKDVKTASGRASVDNADPLAEMLRGKKSDEVIALVEANGGEVNPKWESLNPGLARMAAGNVLRKLAKRTEGIKVDGKKLAIAA